MKKKYEVFITSEEKYEVPVEAEDEEEAIEIALTMLESDVNKTLYHNDSDGHEEAYEV